MEAKANVIEHVKKTNKRKHVGSSSSHGNKGAIVKNFMGTCFVCNKQGHHAKDCRHNQNKNKNKKKKVQANLVDDNDIELAAMVSEVNLVETQKHDGLTPVLLAMYVLIGIVSPSTKKLLRMSNYLWETL